MDERNAYRDRLGERMGNGGNITGQVSETAQDMMEGAAEMGSEALDRADEWLRPVGLSLKERPVMTIAVLAGLGVAIGALWKSRSSSQQTDMMHNMSRMWDQFSRGNRWS